MMNTLLDLIVEKNARIKDLELKLLKSLGFGEFICEDIKFDISIYEDKSWFFAVGDSLQKRLIEVMSDIGISGHPEDYSCAKDLLDDVVRNVNT